MALNPEPPNGGLRAALDHLERALRLLDDSDAPGHIGAHVDLAIHRLQETLRTPTADNSGSWPVSSKDSDQDLG